MEAGQYDPPPKSIDTKIYRSHLVNLIKILSILSKITPYFTAPWMALFTMSVTTASTDFFCEAA